MFTKEQLAEIRKTLKLGDDVKDEQIAERIMLSLTAGVKAKSDLDAANTEIESLKASKIELSTKVTELEAKSGGIELSREVAALSKRELSRELDALVSEGRITPKVKDALLPHLNTTVMLSIHGDDDNAEPGFAGIINALKQNDAVELAKLRGEKTGLQTVALSRDVPGQGGSNKETQKEMADMAWGAESANN